MIFLHSVSHRTPAGTYSCKSEPRISFEHQLILASAEEYRDALLEWGYDTAELVELNGYEAVMYSSEEDGYDYLAVALATESGNIFEVSVHPVSSEEYTAVAYIILSSVQPT